MATKNIHLFDNSWHIKDWTQNDSRRDQYGRKPQPLELTPKDDVALKEFSSRTIGDLMKDEENAVMVWPNSFYEGNEELKEQYIFRITEKDGNKIDSVTTNNVVGFIGKGKTNIRIHSRFSSIDKDGKGDDFFLYYMLEKVMSINMFSFTSSAGSKAPQVFDFLLFFFPKLLKEAMSQGMYKKYVYHEYNDANVRGVIDINRHIRLNIPANGKIAYRTREFSYDNPVTQLIRHTIEFIRRKPFGKAVLHNDPDMEGCVQQIIQATPSFQPRQMQSVLNENLRPVSHPYYTKYAALQKLCLRILRHEKLSYGENGDKIHGILIDAAWLWEEYVAKVLLENGSGLLHFTNRKRDFYLFEREDKGEKHRFQQIIPDYLDKGNRIVADAKYIPLHFSDHLDADRALAVYYKTIMYMYRFEAEKGFLIHPVQQDEANSQQGYIGDEYKIIDTKGVLKKIGMVVPGGKDYFEFKQNLQKLENKFPSF